MDQLVVIIIVNNKEASVIKMISIIRIMIAVNNNCTGLVCTGLVCTGLVLYRSDMYRSSIVQV